ncbi:hypothetical protein L7F22_050883 [Adiantum nelumboides]|nr:hypothetical protein [Adiantum nelumboides]
MGLLVGLACRSGGRVKAPVGHARHQQGHQQGHVAMGLHIGLACRSAGSRRLQQAIQKHKFVNVLHNPGDADLSAYVDFAALKHVVKESSVDAEVFGPITQSAFLGMLGINFRVEALLERAKDDKQAELLKSGYWRLVGDGSAPWWEGEETLAPIGMGSRYKVLAIVKSGLGTPQCFQRSSWYNAYGSIEIAYNYKELESSPKKYKLVQDLVTIIPLE